MARDPTAFDIASLGIGTLGAGIGGVYDAATAPARKRRYLEDERRNAEILALRNSRWTDFFPTNALDAKYKRDAVVRNAEEAPEFNASPASFLPFVQNATQLAGTIYDYANLPEEEKSEPTPQQLQYYNDPVPTPSAAAIPRHSKRRIGLVER